MKHITQNLITNLPQPPINKKAPVRNKRKHGKGFSLVELVVTIAIMAVITSVLAPALLGYVENSRAKKDFAIMDEVTHVVFLAMADSCVYDELAQASIKQNVSCYIDTETEDGHTKIVTKKATKEGEVDQYTFGDDSRIKDETPFYFAGNMRGTTITFEPSTGSNKSIYKLSEGIINKARSDGSTTIADMPRFYNMLRRIISDEIELTSQTYRNSEYTIFIKIGTTGGNQADAQDAAAAYGQFSGTNLPI